MFNHSGINPASGSHCSNTCRVPLFNTSALPADSTCRSCVLPQPPDQNWANKPWAGRRKVLLSDTLMEGQSREGTDSPDHSVFAQLPGRMSHAKSSWSAWRAPKCQCPNSSCRALQQVQESCFPCSNCHVWEFDETWAVPRPQFRWGTQAAMLTLGKVSCPTRSCRCLMVLKAKVLMAKGSHRIMDKSLRRSKNQTFVIHNQQSHCTGPNPAVCTWWTLERNK